MKKTKHILSLAALFVFALNGAVLAQSPLPEPGSAPRNSPVDRHGYLSIAGGKMRGSKSGNEDVQLRGMSFFWGNGGEGAPFYTDGTVGGLVHDWKVDVLRAAIGAANYTGGGGNPGYTDGDAAGQWNQLRTVVEGAIRRGVYVIVDWHTHRAVNYQSQSEQFFKRVVQEWGRYPNIIYEIYNEPCPSGGSSGACVGDDWTSIRNYANRVLDTIRVYEGSGHKNIVIVGTPGWSSFGGWQGSQVNTIKNNLVTGNRTGSNVNIAYSMHFYAADNAHNAYKARVTDMMGGTNPQAVFVSEWGVSAASGSGAINLDNSTDWLNMLDQNKVSWANWSITKKNESSAACSTTASTQGGWRNLNSDLTRSGRYVRNRLRTASFGVTSGIRDTVYTITTPASIEGGSINRSAPGPNYNYDQTVTLTAAPAAGWEFTNWTGDLSGGNASQAVTIKGINLNIGAAFYRGGLIRNGRFASGFTTNPITWRHTSSLNATGVANSPSVQNGELKTAIVSQSNNVEHYYLEQRDIALEGGKAYRLSFLAHADKSRKIAVAVANTTTRATRYMPTREIDLTTQPQVFNIDFVANATGNVTARVEFWYGINATNWTITNISLLEGNYQSGGGNGREFNVANIECWNDGVICNVSTLPRTSPAAKTAWSVTRTGGGLQLNGPALGSAAKVSLYDVRGRLVKNVSFSGGKPLMLSTAAAPAGSYMLVVRDSTGKNVYKTRVLLAK